jgi:ABC-type oligopeptide transport system substrate-binding subunit
MRSVGGQLVRDIVGAPAVLKGTAQTASGITVRGNTLQIKLSSPSGDLDARLATPFFGALPLTLPNAPPFPSAGPYFIAGSTPGSIVLQENTFYSGTRPHHLGGFMVSSDPNRNNLGEVESGRADYVIGGVDSSAAIRLGQTYGVNKGQFQVHALLETDYVALNTARPTFRSLNMRKAANYAIDRPAMLRVRGAFGAQRTDQILPPGMPGFKDARIYPLTTTDYRVAKRLAGHRCKRVKVYATTTPTGIELSHEFKYNLTQIGCNVDVRLFAPSAISAAVARGGYDVVFVGSTANYEDPLAFLDILLGDAPTNINLAHFDNARFNRLLDQASRKVGPARYSAYGKLDILVSKDYAPWAAYDNRNEREFVSKRVGGYLFQPANASADLTTFFLK